MFWTFTVDSKPDPQFISTQGVLMSCGVGEFEGFTIMVFTVLKFCGYSHSVSIASQSSRICLHVLNPVALVTVIGFIAIRSPWFAGVEM